MYIYIFEPAKGSTLRDIEFETDTFCFLEGDVDSSERLLVFGSHRGRKAAEKKVKELVRLRPRSSWNGPDEREERHQNESVVKSEVRITVIFIVVIAIIHIYI